MNTEELRLKFELWVLSTEHQPYGWLDRNWLERGLGDSYTDDYIHGLWTAYSKFAVTPPTIVNEAIQWIDCNERMPEKGVDVLVRYALPWPADTKFFVTGAVLDKPFDDIDRLFWFNGKGEGMRGQVTHWMPMIEV